MSPTFSSSSSLSFIDIGANLLDERYTKGIYFGTFRHEPDWEDMIQRAQQVGVQKIIITAGTLEESRRAIAWVRTLRKQQQHSTHPMEFACTVGVHPTRCSQEIGKYNNNDNDTTDNDNNNNNNIHDKNNVLLQLQELALDGIKDDTVVAIGEIGLDYDRLEFCDALTQQYYIQQQLQIFHASSELQKLPLFLHNRNVGTDLLQILVDHYQQLQIQSTTTTTTTTTTTSLDMTQTTTIPQQIRGVVHSFDDTLELALQFIQHGLYIGLNGCSMKHEHNLQVIRDIPLDRIVLETDCPYCEIKSTHDSAKYIKTTAWKDNKKSEKKFQKGCMVKGRNEPCQIIQVAEVIAQIKGISLQQVADTCYQNTLRLYGWEK